MSTGFQDKFIAFIDILGFSDMVEAAERGEGRSLTEIYELCAALARTKDVEEVRVHGSLICPESTYVRKDLDYNVHQISDCAVISAEISPLGVINVVNHCWSAAVKLLSKGALIRGYVTRGNIAHNGTNFIGTGYMEAFKREGSVAAFKKTADEKGTPFVEIDSKVLNYIRDHTDKCVPEVLNNLIKRDGDIAALFPFKVLTHSFAITSDPSDRRRIRESSERLRGTLEKLKMDILRHVSRENAKAQEKVSHYIDALDGQIKLCIDNEDWLDRMQRPWPSPRLLSRGDD